MKFITFYSHKKKNNLTLSTLRRTFWAWAAPIGNFCTIFRFPPKRIVVVTIVVVTIVVVTGFFCLPIAAHISAIPRVAVVKI